MQCPACERGLEAMTVKGVTVDVCRHGCGGIWFGNFELQRFDEPQEAAGQALLHVERDESVQVDAGGKRRCPKCHDVVLMQHFFSKQRRVEIDECPGCGGIWLDAGELREIRDAYRTEQQREQAAKEYVEGVLGGNWEALKARTDAGPKRKAATIFRFLTPRYEFWGRLGE